MNHKVTLIAYVAILAVSAIYYFYSALYGMGYSFTVQMFIVGLGCYVQLSHDSWKDRARIAYLEEKVEELMYGKKP
jgi:hypothetical protein